MNLMCFVFALLLLIVLHDGTLKPVAFNDPLDTLPIGAHLCKLKNILNPEDASEPLHVVDKLLQIRWRLNNKQVAQLLERQKVGIQCRLLQTHDEIVVVVQVADQHKPAL